MLGDAVSYRIDEEKMCVILHDAEGEFTGRMPLAKIKDWDTTALAEKLTRYPDQHRRVSLYLVARDEALERGLIDHR